MYILDKARCRHALIFLYPGLLICKSQQCYRSNLQGNIYISLQIGIMFQALGSSVNMVSFHLYGFPGYEFLGISPPGCPFINKCIGTQVPKFPRRRWARDRKTAGVSILTTGSPNSRKYANPGIPKCMGCLYIFYDKVAGKPLAIHPYGTSYIGLDYGYLYLRLTKLVVSHWGLHGVKWRVDWSFEGGLL